MAESKTILISGLVNTETTVSVRQFPVSYYPIDYPFFGVNTAVSGVAFNLAKSLAVLGDRVRLVSMTGRDYAAGSIRQELEELGISPEHLLPRLSQTPASAVLYAPDGRRQIYCDLKDIQETDYPFSSQLLEETDLVAACNINFNRPLLAMARAAGKTIATDVHVLTRLDDDFNRDFMAAAQILFLSDEGLGWDWKSFLYALADTYGSQIIVLGRGSKGAALYTRASGTILEVPAARTGPVVNTVGAGDALFSCFLHYFAQGHPPLEALIRAELFAACKIGVSGAAQGFVSPQQVETLYAQQAPALFSAVRG
ncbi:MAG: carbohydrate kinase family protein [Oscillospiraceae bacterium]|nr:carbohydrate kinase family protein [Oscillospiraceae bacterium]